MTNVYCPHKNRCAAWKYNACNGCSYAHIQTEFLLRRLNVPKEPEYPKIKNVRISGHCTIIFWEDGIKTVMKCSEQDKKHFDVEKAILLAFYRKATGFTKTHAQKELTKLTVEVYFNGLDEFVKE